MPEDIVAKPAEELIALTEKKSTPRWVKNLLWLGVVVTTLSGMGFGVTQFALADPTARAGIATLTNKVAQIETQLSRIEAERKIEAEKLAAAIDAIKTEAFKASREQGIISTVGSANAKMLDRVDVKLDTLLQRPVHAHGP